MAADRLELAKLRYEDVVSERDRLRDARAGLTSKLGPLPASAAIVIGLAGTVADKVEQWALIAAGGLFAALVILSILFSSLRPYRIMRAKSSHAGAGELPFPAPEDDDPTTWLERKTRMEEDLYGKLNRSQPVFRLGFSPSDLQAAFDIERSALNLVQLLFVLDHRRSARRHSRPLAASRSLPRANRGRTHGSRRVLRRAVAG